MIIFKLHKHPPKLWGHCLFGTPCVTSDHNVKLLPFHSDAINTKCCNFWTAVCHNCCPLHAVHVTLKEAASSGRGRKVPREEFRSSAWRQNHLKSSWSFTVFCYRTLKPRTYKCFKKIIWIPGISRTINDKSLNHRMPQFWLAEDLIKR